MGARGFIPGYNDLREEHPGGNDVGYRSLAECVRDLERDKTARRHRPGGRPLSGSRRHPAAGLSGGRTGLAVSPGQGDGVPGPGQPVRHARAGEVHLSRRTRVGAQAGRAQGRSGLRWPRTLGDIAARPRTLWRLLAPARAVRADPGPPDRDRSTAANPVLADGRRPVRHACRRSIPKTPTGRACDGRTWGCTGSSSRATSTSRTARSDFITRSIAGSACTTRRRSAAASRSRSTSSSAARPP